MTHKRDSRRKFSISSFLSSLVGRKPATGTPSLAGPAEEAAHLPIDPARSVSFDPQVARRMSQLEAELTRLAESQFAAREERVRLAEEVARLRSARGSVPPAPPEAEPYFSEAEPVAEATVSGLIGTS